MSRATLLNVHRDLQTVSAVHASLWSIVGHARAAAHPILQVAKKVAIGHMAAGRQFLLERPADSIAG